MVGDQNDNGANMATTKTLESVPAATSRPPKRESAKQELRVPGAPRPAPSFTDSADADFSTPEILSDPINTTPAKDTIKPLRRGELGKGRVVGLLASGVVVDIGRKVEGLIDIEEFKEGLALPQLDDNIDVIVQNQKNTDNYLPLSHKSARQKVLSKFLYQAHRDGTPVKAKVVSETQGGLKVDVGLPAFLPRSQIDLRLPQKIKELTESEFFVKIIKFSKLSSEKGDIIVSRRAILEEDLRRRKEKTLSEISFGATVEGTIKSITSYGVFVDIGGIDAFLHITDISYSRVNNPSDIVQVGATIRTKVIKYDSEKEKVSLSLKAMKPDPWETLKDRYKTGDRVSGQVTRVANFGVFLGIEEDIEGLLHQSEVSWTNRSASLAKKFKVGQTVECVISKMDPTKRRLSLSVKALTPDPWSEITQTHPIGTVVEGKVVSMTTYGAFIKLKEDLEGLVHITDLTRDSTVHHPKEILERGHTVRAVVLHVEKTKRRLSLGMKQLEPDPWDDFSACHSVGDVIEARVLHRTSSGILVEPAPGLKTLCHWTELGGSQKTRRALKSGRVYNFQILDLDNLRQQLRLGRRGVPRKEIRKIDNNVVSNPKTRPIESSAQSSPQKSSRSEKTPQKKVNTTRQPKPSLTFASYVAISGASVKKQR
ncbi:MAG: hypothetical protein CMN58_03525 [Solibacterales bacterium]|nr:hypothetical protein [Bryobacterales bacterium]|tara:strand:+ start:13415 stop:15373 length:1959 start_codon:yes stop_codon:yes gene_type:complete